GLCQNVKYYGWLAGAIVVLAAVVGTIVDREARTRAALLRTFGWGLVAVLVAGLIYWPWFRFVEAHGGYAELIRHQRGYFLGVGAWVGGLRRQLEQVVALSGGWPWALSTWVVVSVVSIALIPGGPARSRRVAHRIVGLGVLGTLWIVSPTLSWWLGLAWAPWLLSDVRPSRRVLGAWWLSQSVLTPLYVPYARLWLPLHAAGWVLVAGATEEWDLSWDAITSRRRALQNRAILARSAFTAIVVLVGFWVSWNLTARPFPLPQFFEPTDGLRNAVVSLARSRTPSAPRFDSLRVLGRRPIAYYLALQGGFPVRLEGGGENLSPRVDAPGEWLLIDFALDPATLDPVLRGIEDGRSWRRAESPTPVRLDPVTRLDVRPGSVQRASEEPTALWLLSPVPRVAR
ncbi:MAG: hypothetical protein AB7I30_23160, partial [Isosphaeraceae bacterium]